jgi:fucose permease
VVRVTAYWGFVVLGVANTILGPALLPILAEFHISPSGAGPLFLASSVGYVLAVLIGGPAGDHWNRGLVLRAGAAVMCFGLAILFLSPFWLVLVAGLCVLGIGGGVIDSGTNALMNDVAPPDGHAREQSLLHSFFGIGALLGPLLIGAFLALHASWRGAYAVNLAGAVVLVVMFSRLRLPSRSSTRQHVSVRSVLALGLTPFVLVMALMMGVYVGAELLLGDWSAAYLQDVHGLSKVAAATSVSLYWGGLAVGRLLSALATRWLTGGELLLITCVLSLVACFALVAAPNAPIALIALTFCGLGFAAVFPLVMAVAGEVYPEVAGSIAGLLIAAATIFGSAVPWIGGVMVQYFDARAALAISIPAGVVMFALAVVIVRHRPAAAMVSSTVAALTAD